MGIGAARVSAKCAGQSGAGLIELHHISDVREFGKLELIGQSAEFCVRRLLRSRGFLVVQIFEPIFNLNTTKLQRGCTCAHCKGNRPLAIRFGHWEEI